MRVLYFYRVPLPDARADAIQIVNTCAGMAHAGAQVSLHVESLGPGGTQEALAFYGVAPPAASGSFDIAALGRHWSWPFFGIKLGRILKSARAGDTILFVREVRPYVPGLIRKAKAAGCRVLFEAHNVSASLVAEKAAKAAPGPRSFSMIDQEGRTSLKIVGEPAGHDHHDHEGHDHHDDEHHEEPAPIPVNADPTPAPPPAPHPADSPEARELKRRAAERAALEKEIIESSDGIICTQRATLDGLRHLFRPGFPAIVLGNGTQIHDAAPGGARDLDILYCGSLKPWKGVDMLVAAMQTLYPWTLTIVGPQTKEDVARLQQAALTIGALERVKILPSMKPTEVWKLYARAKVGVIPLPGSEYIEARVFTSPLKLFEMMAAGLPVVASRLPSILEYVADGRDALLVMPDVPRALAEGIRRVLTEPALARSLSEAGRARAAEYSWDRRGAKLVEFARQVLTSRAPS